MNEHAIPRDWREGRRLRAWELMQQGWKQKDIAEALGVTGGSGESMAEASARGRRRGATPSPVGGA